MLPLASVTDAVIATAPSGRLPTALAGTVTLQEPSDWTVVVKFCPARVTVTVCPASTCCVLPVNVSGAPFSAALITSSPETVLIVINGATPTRLMLWVAVPVLPAASVTETIIVLTPRSSVRVRAGSRATFQVPSASTTPVSTPVPNFTVTVSPGEAPLTRPEIICATACSALLRISSPATVLTLIVGTWVSTVKFALSLVIFPARSLTLALSV